VNVFSSRDDKRDVLGEKTLKKSIGVRMRYCGYGRGNYDVADIEEC
jgi:uncharacterized protein with GYD domain